MIYDDSDELVTPAERAQERKLDDNYRDKLAAYLRGEQVTTRKGRPWPKDERSRWSSAARLQLKRIAECEPPLPVVHEQPPREDSI